MQKLGAGSFSTVHLLRRYNSNEYYALKEFGNKYKHGHIADRARARMEYQYGVSLGEHAHTVKYLQLYEDEANLFILMEYCARGNLEQFLKQHALTPLKNDWGETLIWRFLRDLLSVRTRVDRRVRHVTNAAQGLEHIHHKNYVHLDLKPSNIFITERGTLKIGDYGVMRTAEEIKRKMLNSDPAVSYNDIEEFKHMIEGDSRYLAPEFQQSPSALNSSGAHTRTTRSRARTSMIGPWSDIWALGLIVLELALDIIVPAGGSEQWTTLRAGIFPDTLEQSSISPSLRELVKWMMMPNPNDRPTASQLLQHYRGRLNDDSIAVDFDSFVKRDSRALLTNSVGLRDSMEIEAWNSEISTHYQASFDRKAVKTKKREVSLAVSGAFMNEESSSEESDSQLSAVTPVNPAPLLNPAMPIMPRKLSFADMEDD